MYHPRNEVDEEVEKRKLLFSRKRYAFCVLPCAEDEDEDMEGGKEKR